MLRMIQDLYESIRPIDAGDAAINPDVTVVTAYVEIPIPGRTEAAFAQRNRERYLQWMRPVLSIHQKMIVFVEPQNREFVLDVRTRKGLHAETVVRTIDVEALRRSPWHAEVERIIEGGHMRHAVRPDRIELKSPLYNTIMFHKTAWVREAIAADPFHTKYFMWMDAGYGHGLDRRFRYRGVVDHVWPSAKKNHLMANKVLVLETGSDAEGLSAADMMTRHHTLVAGGIWGGDRDVLLQFFDHFDHELSWTFSRNLLDDEQSVMSQVYRKHPELFGAVDCQHRLRDRCYFMKYLDSSGA